MYTHIGSVIKLLQSSN